MFRYALNGGRPLEKSLYSFKTIQGGTSRLERHIKSRRSGSATLNFQRNLPRAARGKVATAAALAVCLDLRPLSFCDGHTGLRHFAKSIFELGQTVSENEKIDPKSYLLGRTDVTSAVKDLSNNLRQKYFSDVQNSYLRFGGAITIEGVHLKVHSKNNYDFTLHFIKIKEKGPFSDVQFTLKMLHWRLLKVRTTRMLKTSRVV